MALFARKQKGTTARSNASSIDTRWVSHNACRNERSAFHSEASSGFQRFPLVDDTGEEGRRETTDARVLSTRPRMNADEERKREREKERGKDKERATAHSVLTANSSTKHLAHLFLPAKSVTETDKCTAERVAH